MAHAPRHNSRVDTALLNLKRLLRRDGSFLNKRRRCSSKFERITKQRKFCLVFGEASLDSISIGASLG